LGKDDGVEVSVDGSIVSHEDLVDFDNGGPFCLSTVEERPNITITFPAVVQIMEIGIRGNNIIFPFPDQYITNYTLSYLEEGGDFVDYINDLHLTVSDAFHMWLFSFSIVLHCFRFQYSLLWVMASNQN